MHMFSEESLQSMKNILRPGGIVTINFNGPASSLKVSSLYKTIKTVFNNVFIVVDEEPEYILSPKFFFATDVVVDKTEIKKNMSRFIDSDLIRETLSNVIDNYTIDYLEGGVLVTDDYNPLDNFQIDSTIAWREKNWDVFGSLLLR